MIVSVVEVVTLLLVLVVMCLTQALYGDVPMVVVAVLAGAGAAAWSWLREEA